VNQLNLKVSENGFSQEKQVIPAGAWNCPADILRAETSPMNCATTGLLWQAPEGKIRKNR